MAGIASPVPEIDALFFRPAKANRPITIVRGVKLKDDDGWLLEDNHGQIHAAGRLEKQLNQNAYIIGVVAQNGSLWGHVLEGLVSMGKISKEHVAEHRRTVGERTAANEKARDLKYVEKMCQEHGWSLNTGAPSQAEETA